MHLAPLSRPEHRVWEVGAVRSEPAPEELRLAVRPGDYRSFASLEAILEQLRPMTAPRLTPGLNKLRRYVREASPDEPGGHGRFLSDAVAYAVLRRISRESVYTAKLVDHGAHTLNLILTDLPVKRVTVPSADRLDRPTLKLLARAMLVAPRDLPFAWVWSFGALPRRAAETDLAEQSRAGLFEQLAGMLSPAVAFNGAEQGAPPPRKIAPGRNPTYEMSAALVLQNYDACFAWGEELSRGDATAGEALRLMALAAVNLGRTDAAGELLERSEASCGDPFRLAHLAYLQGLIAAKRSYAPDASDAHYHRGLAALQDEPSDSDGSRLERAWLFNGLALNRAIEWRRDVERTAAFEEAFRLVKDAFDLVKEDRSPACGYLRFNLIANLAFLLEMRGRYDLAIESLEKAFDFGPGSPTELPAGHVALCYRIGILRHRLGDHEGALELLREAEAVDDSAESWPTRERILRSIGAVGLAAGALEEAETAFRSGLGMARANRSAEGTSEHGRGLAAAMVRQGRTAEAEEMVANLVAEESLAIDLPERGGPRPPNPKLPAYFPEIDLEEVPAIDLNRYLAAPTLVTGGSAS